MSIRFAAIEGGAYIPAGGWDRTARPRGSWYLLYVTEQTERSITALDRLRRLRPPGLSESNLLILLALVIGVAGGLAAVGLDGLLEVIEEAGLWVARNMFSFLGDYRIAVVPVLGALVAGPLIYRGAIEAKGHGVPEVMEAVALRGGRIRARVALVKTVASAFTIGSGGSAGREGPIVQIGATLGSSLAQFFDMSESRMRTLAAAGAAAGVAAAFNAPLAGVFFSLEVILQRFTTRGFAVVVLSAISSSVVWRAFKGNAPVFDVPLFSLEHPLELLFYVALGLGAAVVAVAFVWVLYRIEDLFDEMRFLDDLKPALGAIPVGLFGVASVLVLGTGIEGINQALSGELTIMTLSMLLGAKIVATSLTLGSGASGGIFSPSLFLGAMLGGVFGRVLTEQFPGVAGPEGAYVLVGMAAVFAAAAQAPMTSILIVFEMTNDYSIMLALMMACVTSTLVYGALKQDSIYMVKLRRKGVQLDQGRDRHLLESIPVAKVFKRDVPVIQAESSFEDAAILLEETNQDSLIAVSDNRLVGTVLAADVHEAIAEERRDLSELISRDVPTCGIEESLDDALRKMAPRDLPVLPVVDPTGVLLGSVSREAIFRAYGTALAEEERGAGPPPG